MPTLTCTHTRARALARAQSTAIVTVADYRLALVVDMALCALNKRLVKRSMEPVRPFTSATVGEDRVVNALSTVSSVCHPTVVC